MKRVSVSKYIEKNRGYKKVYLLHDNARPHVSKKTKSALEKMDFEVLSHPPYSPDLAPTDFHLFLLLSNQIRNKVFNNTEELKTFVKTFSLRNQAVFSNLHSKKLTLRWKKTIENKGEYLLD